MDDKGERAAARAAADLRLLFGDRLVAAALYGSSIGADYVPGKSDINLVAVLDRVHRDDLETLRPLVGTWRRRGLATPLVIDRDFLKRAADSFPMELNDLANRHRVLVGEDIFASIAIAPERLREQCEREARGKLLRLRSLYLEAGDTRRALRALMLDSLKTFLAIMRAMNCLAGEPPDASYRDVVDTFARRFDAPIPAIRTLLAIRSGREHWPGNTRELFRAYCADVELIALRADRLAPDAPAPIR